MMDEQMTEADRKMMNTFRQAKALAKARSLPWDTISFEVKKVLFSAVLDGTCGEGYSFAPKRYEFIMAGFAFCLVYEAMMHGCPPPYVPKTADITRGLQIALDKARYCAEGQKDVFNTRLATLAFNLELHANRRI